ncbi:HSPB1-associated protein 1 [Orchesella cincta]|uniref:HSPB1-associated protein 1 n=1 Tax=Orchesella cincta TaxID=48709 RepID=A0A1D2N1Y9_ORCCI|nr:HSPB1-associated protein 1 [Orchesella cincta]
MDDSSKILPLRSISGDPAAIGRNQFVSNKFAECLRELILKDKIGEPLVFRKIHEDWAPCKWTLGDWGDIFRDEKLSVRYGRQKWDKNTPQWESSCGNLEITWTKLIEWIRGEYNLPIPNSSPQDIWMYYDYKYLPEVIHLKSESEKDFLKLIYLSENLKKKFCWSNLGFHDRNGDHSTLWIGTSGSYTNTHYDTYSCNLVCQVYGKKTWLVFPPCDTEYLQPTRVPYEESSVYSQINVASSKQIQNNISAVKKCSPRRITLEPGDCLYLPPKWWHFVKSEDFSISVNTWIELPSDHFTRVEEAVLRAVVSSFVNSTVPSTADKVLNPNEMDLTEIGEKDTEDTLRLASKAFIDYENSISQSQSAEKSDKVSEPQVKKPKLSNEEISLEKLMEYSSVCVEKPSPFKLEVEALASCSETSSESSSSQLPSNVDCNHEAPPKGSPTYFEDVLNAVGHPDVLKQIAQRFLHNVKQRKSSD